jgi:hypothetical protein
MAIKAIRFRSEGELLALQVCEEGERDFYANRHSEPKWRDAKTEDLLQVAAYTRAHDSLDRMIATMTSNVERVINQNQHLLDQRSACLDSQMRQPD